MKFVIRDDDLNYFSAPADVELSYRDIFAAGIPVGFSVIPFVKPVSDVYPMDITPSDEEHPVSRNAALVAYVKEQPLIEVLQHGTTHETTTNGYEYAAHVLRGETARGRAELERTFDRTVRIFVPPHDWIGTSGLRDVEASNMDVIRGRGAGLRAVMLRPQYLLIFLRMLFFKLRYAYRSHVPAYPYVIDFGTHKEACSYRLEDEDVFEGLEYAYRKNGIFVVVAHVHFYTAAARVRLQQLINRAYELGAEFVPPSALFNEQP